jgi:hypothetical protein
MKPDMDLNSTFAGMPRTPWWRRYRVVAALAIPALVLLVLGQQARTAWTIGVAYRYALPLYEVMRVRYATVSDPGNPRRVPLNTFVHRRRLADHADRLVTMPNNDTLYSLAVLDLSSGPVRLDVPDSGGRYYSAALMDAYTNNFSIIGRRTTGTRAGSYLIAGPGWEHDSPDGGMQVIHAPSPTVLLLVRILVDGPDDVDAVTALQDGFHLSAPKADKPGAAAPVPLANDAARFVAVVDRALAENPPPADDAAMLARLAPVGIAPGEGALGSSLAAAWKRDFPWAQKLLAHAVARPRQLIQGWSYLPPDIGNFGTDYDVRAGVALVGLMALPPEEAMYANGLRDAQDREFSGTHRYRLHLPRGGVPAEAFWSLSMYEAQPDGRAFFADNPLHRYAIGDRTPGLVRNADGSLDLLIQHQQPAEAQRGNWLPAPAGPFRLAMRAYQPKRELLDGSFRYPGVERLD